MQVGDLLLNDLLVIEKGLRAQGILLAGRHPDVKDMAKGWALRVRLGADCRIAALDFVPEAGRGALWTLRDGQHNGFPGLKTGAGLLHLEDHVRDALAAAWESDKTPASRRRELLRLYGNNSVDADQLATWPAAGHRKRIAERLQSLMPLANDPLTAAVPAAFERFLVALDASPSFLEDLARAVAKRVRESEDKWLDPARAALTGPIALAIDVVEDEFDRDAGDPRQVGPVSAALSVTPNQAKSQAEYESLCALSGGTAKLHSGNFPQPNLPGLGQTYIFSRNRDIPSLTRYGRTADASFPVDASLLRRLAGAITKLTEEDDKGRTWRLIQAETGDKLDLLVVSMAEPELRPAAALSDDEEIGGEAALGELASRVIDQSDGVYEHNSPQSEVTVLILRTVDPANRKTIYHRKTAAADVWEAARRWQSATSNTPDWLILPSPGKGKSEIVLRRPPYVAPLSIVPISRVQFANGGKRRVGVIGTTAAAAFSLFLHEDDVAQSARSLLRMLTRRQKSLLGGLAAARAKGTNYLEKFDPKSDLRRDALRSVTWIGALLYHLRRSKEIYMSDVAFRLGQLLETADIVHIGYCADLRGGDVPPSPLGNSVLAIAGSDPKRALAILESRLKPYLAWAKREERIRAKIRELRTKDPKTEEQKKANRLSFAISNAFYSAPRLRAIADELRPVVKQQETGDAFRAELLLGYLAGLPPGQRKAGSSLDDRDNGSRDQSEEQQS